MKKNPPIAEEALRTLQACPLDDSFLTRLEASADGVWTELTQDEIRFENLLKEFSPSKLSPELLTNLEAITAGVHFPVSEKILLFPKGNGIIQKRERRSFLAAAAAVALIGAISALLVSTNHRSGITNEVANSAIQSFPASGNSRFVQAGFESGVSNVHDEGVVWKTNNAPHRLVRVEYMDHSTYKDSNGRTIEVERPREKFMLLPTHPD
jgi:hypothetical protein